MCIVIFRRWIFRGNELTTLGHPCIDRNIFKRTQRSLDHLIVLSVLVSDPLKFSTSENKNAHLRVSNLKFALVVVDQIFGLGFWFGWIHYIRWGFGLGRIHHRLGLNLNPRKNLQRSWIWGNPFYKTSYSDQLIIEKL